MRKIKVSIEKIQYVQLYYFKIRNGGRENNKRSLNNTGQPEENALPTSFPLLRYPSYSLRTISNNVIVITKIKDRIIFSAGSDANVS